MSDRLQALEREKLDLIEKAAQSEEELRDSFAQERNKLNEKIGKLKGQVYEGKEKLELNDRKISELEKELISVKKENESLFSRIAEMSKEASEKLENLKSMETK